MPQIYDMGPTALLPLRRKACWGFFRPKNPTASAGCSYIYIYIYIYVCVCVYCHIDKLVKLVFGSRLLSSAAMHLVEIFMIVAWLEVPTWLMPESLRTTATKHLIVDIILTHRQYSSTAYVCCRSTILALAVSTGVFLWTRWWNCELLMRRLSMTGLINQSAIIYQSVGGEICPCGFHKEHVVWGGRGIAPVILNVGTGGRQVVRRQ